MKFLVSALITLSLASFAWAKDNHQNNKYFQIKKVTVKEIPNDLSFQPQGVTAFNDCGTNTNAAKPSDISGLSEVNVFVDQIINLGKKAWDIIAAGTPVVNLKFDTANALPTGVKCWTELQSWSMPQTKTYQIQYENGFGMNVVDFTYRVSFIPGGNYKGQGKFITNAVVQPAALNVTWGFTFNANAEIPVVFNQGTTENPVAGLQLNVHWSVDSVVSHDESTETFFINGAGLFQKMQ